MHLIQACRDLEQAVGARCYPETINLYSIQLQTKKLQLTQKLEFSNEPKLISNQLGVVNGFPALKRAL